MAELSVVPTHDNRQLMDARAGGAGWSDEKSSDAQGNLPMPQPVVERA
ncbi:MAG: hypothetical protein ACRDTX_09465 [Pseudonocardiaceae bacterium]